MSKSHLGSAFGLDDMNACCFSGEKQIRMELMLPWKYEVSLEYAIVTDWPLTKHG